jgi:hypothetical protein
MSRSRLVLINNKSQYAYMHAYTSHQYNDIPIGAPGEVNALQKISHELVTIICDPPEGAIGIDSLLVGQGSIPRAREVREWFKCDSGFRPQLQVLGGTAECEVACLNSQDCEVVYHTGY